MSDPNSINVEVNQAPLKPVWPVMNIFLFVMALFVVKTRKILLISWTLLVLFIALSALGNFGKSDPFNRLFIKTFNQITNYKILGNKIDLSNGELPKIKKNKKKKYSNIFN